MTSRRSPTLRLRRLSTQLKRLRLDAGITTAAEASKLAGWHPSKLSRLESAQAPQPNVVDIEKLLDIYKVTDDITRRTLVRLAHDALARGWWQSYRLPGAYETYIGLEAEAAVVREFSVLAVPGLLQTQAYAEAAISGRGPNVPVDQVAKYTRIRMERKDRLLYDPDPVHLWVVLDESVLHRRFGTAEVMRAQMEALRKAADLPNVTIQILRFEHGQLVGPGGFSLLAFSEPTDDDAVYVDTPGGARWVEGPDEVVTFRIRFEELIGAATARKDTVRLLDEAVDRWCAHS